VASKYPHLISSASFFNPSAAFFIGPRDMQVYTPFSEMAMNYAGLPVRMHIGMKDFLRQHDLAIDNSFKTRELFYESWHYNVNYFRGFHTVVNVEGQFDFHMKHFRMTYPKPRVWNHIDVYPDFDIWGYSFESDRRSPGFTILEHVNNSGFKLLTRRWLPDGPEVPDVHFQVVTAAEYKVGSHYELLLLDLAKLEVRKTGVSSGFNGRLSLQLPGSGVDVGIYRAGDAGVISVPDFRLDSSWPRAWQDIRFYPLLFNKGGQTVDSVHVDVISLTPALEVLTTSQTVGPIASGEVVSESCFTIRARAHDMDAAAVKVRLQYAAQVQEFYLEIPFYNDHQEVGDFRIADGRSFKLDNGELVELGNGNGDGIVNAGERLCVLTQSDRGGDVWYGLRLYTDDGYVDRSEENAIWHLRPDWSGTARQTSEILIAPDCPAGHEIEFYGRYDFQKRGNLRRDRQGAHSFVHETRRVGLKVRVQ
jgi:hypothetical protein